MSLSVTNTLIRAVEKMGLAKIRFGETHFSTALFNVFVILSDNKAHMYL